MAEVRARLNGLSAGPQTSPNTHLSRGLEYLEYNVLTVLLMNTVSCARESVFCPFCDNIYTRSGLNRHLAQSKLCGRLERERALAAHLSSDSVQPNATHLFPEHLQIASDIADEALAAENLQQTNFEEFLDPLHDIPSAEYVSDPAGARGEETEQAEFPRVHVTHFPDELAGCKIEKSETIFETWSKQETEQGSKSVFNDFGNWELAHWLITSGLSGSAHDKFFKLRVSCLLAKSIENNKFNFSTGFGELTLED